MAVHVIEWQHLFGVNRTKVMKICMIFVLIFGFGPYTFVAG